jgi:hypothetical protein
MCSCFQRNKNPQTVKLYQVIGSLALAKFPAGQICYVFDADAPKPPTYPFNYSSSSKSTDTNKTAHPNLGRLPSCIQIPLQALHPASLNSPSASLRPSRFGKAVFRGTRQNPQGQKSPLAPLFYSFVNLTVKS